ncbi:DUF3283 family protein [Photobacterium carnosum]|jgi:hypothetical protein|uniref:Pyridoxamine 5-phosphate oxidase n=1 Tax=Photobacterium carnosum TaxID=2023717 RepID=A0A2N4USG6_9GAMM|nr:DUF3283 family protein [Photobacterium carnosum]KAE8177776.1 pyridoxamine 5-phosphate oxidase [Photobacterium carnosum]MBY3787730.1 DUF3283 family protein [Photobacterium carnosum]MCD9494295.1 DUF3283 family protein [Photobacterium carnosum]MCD9497216.1 DUF3283 family protein [Photobacterium carnosum]MCD9514740.1 DUF3283 family protein [Photobacterium carnosum]
MYNLTQLSDTERMRIELDKQASYTVWKVKNSKVGYEAFAMLTNNIEDDDERDFCQQAIMKYKTLMGVN